MATPSEILDVAFKRASSDIGNPAIENLEVRENIRYVCRHSPGAPARFLVACALAKTHNPTIDIRKPYTEIAGTGSYSGRVYDERYVDTFVNQYKLPLNKTTAFLTPAFRTWISTEPILPDAAVRARKNEISTYRAAFQTLADIEDRKATAEEVLVELIRQLLLIKSERQLQLDILRPTGTSQTLPAERIVTLIQQHMSSPRSSRLPVLVVAAAYTTAERYLQERVLPFEGHNVADDQSGAIGDLEITLLSDSNIVTCYEMKKKRITINDIENAVEKVLGRNPNIDNYIFITTEPITPEVFDYAKSQYDETGIEFAILDCTSFLRHFLHLFYRLRMQFLDTYEDLVLGEPESAVNHDLKIAFLALKQAALQ